MDKREVLRTLHVRERNGRPSGCCRVLLVRSGNNFIIPGIIRSIRAHPLSEVGDQLLPTSSHVSPAVTSPANANSRAPVLSTRVKRDARDLRRQRRHDDTRRDSPPSPRGPSAFMAPASPKMPSAATAHSPSSSRSRPSTPHDPRLLKAVRYEDALDGTPPRPVATTDQFQPASSTSRLSRGTTTTTTTTTTTIITTAAAAGDRPRTTPSPRVTWSPAHCVGELKRDSGIAPSVSAVKEAPTSSLADTLRSSPASGPVGATQGSNLPTIVVRDNDNNSDNKIASLPAEPTGPSRFSFGKRRSRGTSPRPRTASSAVTGTTCATEELVRTGSFHGIQSDIPSGTFDGFDLQDLATDKVGFSARGSLMLGGRKMKELLDMGGNEPLRSAGNALPTDGQGDSGARGITSDDKTRDGSVTAEERDGRQSANGTHSSSEAPRRGLVAGRRQPSRQTLQTGGSPSGRVLSAEEKTFSLKVRSMYEAGDERAAQWIAPTFMAAGTEADSSSHDGSIDSVAVARTRPFATTTMTSTTDQAHVHPMLRSPTPNSYIRQTHELAGGIEDWEEVEGCDVDRYGFIVPRSRDGSRASGQHGRRHSGNKLRRKASRGDPSSRNYVPGRTSADGAAGSTHSGRSQRSQRSGVGRPVSSNPFRSRDRRTVDAAVEMLVPPAGEPEAVVGGEDGAAQRRRRRREREREEKWQKMAKCVGDGREKTGAINGASEKTTEVGGGMTFEFDTTDATLVGRTWKGIPDRWRATAWWSFLAASARRRGVATDSEALMTRYATLQQHDSADDVQIDVDVPRTVGTHIMFRRRYRGGQRLLFRVLHAISLEFPGVGYVQGMASVAATLLCYFDEERAFVMLVRMWRLRGMAKLFGRELDGLMAALQQFERRWLAHGEVGGRLAALGVGATAYGPRWYLTLFHRSVPFAAQLRVWDVFMLLGDGGSSAGRSGGGGEGEEFDGADLDVLHATGAALMDARRDELVAGDFDRAMAAVTSLVAVRDEDVLMRVVKAEWGRRR